MMPVTEQFSITKFIVIGLQQLSPYIFYVTDLLIILCLGLLFWALYKRESYFAQIAPILQTSLGIIGILFGIAVSLSVFDQHHMEQSISFLFNGLMIAFVTGTVGISSAVIVNWINKKAFYQKSYQNNTITPKDIYQILKQINDVNADQKAISSEIADQINQFQKVIKKVIILQHNALDQETRLTEELKRCIVGKSDLSLMEQMQQWQKDRVDHTRSQPITPASSQILNAGEELEKSRFVLQEIEAHTQAIPQTMQQLAQMTTALHQQLNEMTLFLNKYQSLYQQLIESNLIIEKPLNALIQEIQQKMQSHLTLLETALETQLDMADVALETQLEGFNTLQQGFLDLKTKIYHHIHEESRVHNEAQPSSHRETSIKPSTEENLTTAEDFESTKPDYGEILQDRAYTFMELGRYQEAVHLFEQAIEFKPQEFTLFYNKACCYALQGQTDLAITALQEAISLNPECLEMGKTDSDFDSLRDDPRFQSLMNLN